MILFLMATFTQPHKKSKFAKKAIDKIKVKEYNYTITQLHFYKRNLIMTIATFVEQYKNENLVNEALPVGTTALRNWIKENKSDLEKEGLVKVTKALNSQKIDILKPDALYEKIMQ